MRMTPRKREILRLFEPEQRELVEREIGGPPFDVSGVAYLLFDYSTDDNRHQIESTRRTLEAMVKDGLLEKIMSYEQRSNAAGGDGIWCNCSRYGLPGRNIVVRDTGGKHDAIEGEWERL